MANVLLSLLLSISMLLPPGVCPCHLFFGDAHEAGHVNAACSNHDTDECRDVDRQAGEPAHDEHEEPCPDCQIRKLFAGSCLAPSIANPTDDAPVAAHALLPMVTMVPARLPAQSAIPLTERPVDETPLYLKVRALLI